MPTKILSRPSRNCFIGWHVERRKKPGCTPKIFSLSTWNETGLGNYSAIRITIEKYVKTSWGLFYVLLKLEFYLSRKYKWLNINIHKNRVCQLVITDSCTHDTISTKSWLIKISVYGNILYKL